MLVTETGSLLPLERLPQGISFGRSKSRNLQHLQRARLREMAPAATVRLASGTFLLTVSELCCTTARFATAFGSPPSGRAHPAWKVLKTTARSPNHPLPERCALGAHGADSAERSPNPRTGSRAAPRALQDGMARFDEGKSAEPRPYFHPSPPTSQPRLSPRTRSTSTICLFREAGGGSDRGLEVNAAASWGAGSRRAYYHIGLSYRGWRPRQRA